MKKVVSTLRRADLQAVATRFSDATGFGWGFAFTLVLLASFLLIVDPAWVPAYLDGYRDLLFVDAWAADIPRDMHVVIVILALLLYGSRLMFGSALFDVGGHDVGDAFEERNAITQIVVNLVGPFALIFISVFRIEMGALFFYTFAVGVVGGALFVLSQDVGEWLGKRWDARQAAKASA